MLVLTRRVGESVRIGDQIEVVVVAVKGDQVRVGVRAPREVPVVRAELLDLVERENAAAADARRHVREAEGSLVVNRIATR